MFRGKGSDSVDLDFLYYYDEMLSSLTFLNARNVPSSEKYLQMLIRLLQYLTPDSLQIDEVIREVSTAVLCAVILYCTAIWAVHCLLWCYAIICVVCCATCDMISCNMLCAIHYAILFCTIISYITSYHIISLHIISSLRC